MQTTKTKPGPKVKDHCSRCLKPFTEVARERKSGLCTGCHRELRLAYYRDYNRRNHRQDFSVATKVRVPKEARETDADGLYVIPEAMTQLPRTCDMCLHANDTKAFCPKSLSYPKPCGEWEPRYRVDDDE